MYTTSDLLEAESFPDEWDTLLLVCYYYPMSAAPEMVGYVKTSKDGKYFMNGYSVYVYIPEPMNRVTKFGRA